MNSTRQLSQLTVNLSYLKQNILELRKLQPGKELLFMVKADAYGHGLLPIVQFSFEEAGVRSFGVACVKEALTIRKELPELECDIYVFSEVALDIKSNKELYLNYRIFPVISSHTDLDTFLNTYGDQFKFFPLCLKFNTGMNRLGFSCDEVALVAEKIVSRGRSEIFHLMSHFANSSLSLNKNKRNGIQRDRFENIKRKFGELNISFKHSSLANSGALEQGFKSDDDFIRPGLMLYGPSSLSLKHRDLGIWKAKNISKLETTVIKVFPVNKGDPLSYGSTPCPESGQVIILPLGYGDGINSSYQKAKINFGKFEGHVCARVCMDMITILVSKDIEIKEGERLAIWSYKGNSLNDLSIQTKTIPYELVIQLTSRVPRVYMTGEIDLNNENSSS